MNSHQLNFPEATDRATKWAIWRFSIVSPLFSAPPAAGELGPRLSQLAATVWEHPLNRRPVQVSASTIERWYYRARNVANPIEALRRKTRRDQGQQPKMPDALAKALRRQHADHPTWSMQLHHRNLIVLAEQEPNLGPVPSYSTIRRFLKQAKLRRQLRKPFQLGEAEAADRHEARETRSYEVTHVNGLWHADFHQGRIRVLNESGVWCTPCMLAFIDDRSRFICHAQWYSEQTARVVAHGLSLAICRAGLPRELLTDNGREFTATEITCGLTRLSIRQHCTQPYSPQQKSWVS